MSEFSHISDQLRSAAHYTMESCKHSSEGRLVILDTEHYFSIQHNPEGLLNLLILFKLIYSLSNSAAYEIHKKIITNWTDFDRVASPKRWSRIRGTVRQEKEKHAGG